MITQLTALKNYAGFIRYFKNTSLMMGEQFLRIIAGLLVSIYCIEDIYSRNQKSKTHGKRNANRPSACSV